MMRQKPPIQPKAETVRVVVIEDQRELREQFPDLPILVLTVHGTEVLDGGAPMSPDASFASPVGICE